MTLRTVFTFVVRQLGGARLLDKCRFLIMRFLNYRKNAQFRQEFPDARLPPAYLVYESFQLKF